MLTKLSALGGMLECDEVAEALVRVPIPEFADWCAITFIESKKIGRTFLAHSQSRRRRRCGTRSCATLRPGIEHPLWQGMLTSGFQLLTEVNDDLLRRMASSRRNTGCSRRSGFVR